MDYLNAFDFSNKTVAITGGASGIGLEVAKAFVSCGANVALMDLNETNLQAAKTVLDQQINAAHNTKNTHQNRVGTYGVDVVNEQAVKDCAEEIVSEFARVDVLVNSAGIARLHSALEITPEEWARVMDVNVNGTFWSCRAFGEYMIQAGSGSIINMGSMSGSIINQPQLASSYMASKSAVHHLTKALAVEWARKGVRVNALAPGYIATEMTLEMRAHPELFDRWIEQTPMGRCGEPSEVAALILFLASEASSYLTGSIVAVDGGYTCL